MHEAEPPDQRSQAEPGNERTRENEAVTMFLRSRCATTAHTAAHENCPGCGAITLGVAPTTLFSSQSLQTAVPRLCLGTREINERIK